MIKNGASNLTFWEHLEALRKVFIKILCLICIGTATALYFYPQVLNWITSPLSKKDGSFETSHVYYTQITNPSKEPLTYTVPENTTVLQDKQTTILPSNQYLILPGGFLDLKHLEPVEKTLLIFSPIEGIIAVFKTCFWLGTTATSPYWLFLLLQFIAPALRQREQKILFPFVILSSFFLGLGFLFAYYITIPLGNAYLNSFNEKIATNMWGLSHYLNYTWGLLFANMIAYEFFVILLFLIHFKIIEESRMKRSRKGVCVAIFIVSAILTPPDIFTLFMLAIPLMGLYELGILYAKWKSVTSHKYKQDRAYHAHLDNHAISQPTRQNLLNDQ